MFHSIKNKFNGFKNLPCLLLFYHGIKMAFVCYFQHQYLTTWSVEVHCEVRDDLIPDPKFDSISAIFIFISNDVPDSYTKPKQLFSKWPRVNFLIGNQ